MLSLNVILNFLLDLSLSFHYFSYLQRPNIDNKLIKLIFNLTDFINMHLFHQLSSFLCNLNHALALFFVKSEFFYRFFLILVVKKLFHSLHRAIDYLDLHPSLKHFDGIFLRIFDYISDFAFYFLPCFPDFRRWIQVWCPLQHLKTVVDNCS